MTRFSNMASSRLVWPRFHTSLMQSSGRRTAFVLEHARSEIARNGRTAEKRKRDRL